MTVMPTDRSGRAVQVLGVKKAQNVTIGAASAAVTNAFADSTQTVRLATDAACWVSFAETPTAVADASNGSVFMPANFVEFFRVGSAHKVAVIRDGTSSGTLSVGEME